MDLASLDSITTEHFEELRRKSLASQLGECRDRKGRHNLNRLCPADESDEKLLELLAPESGTDRTSQLEKCVPMDQPDQFAH